MPLRFAKWHGLGNDFVVVEGPLSTPERARRICDRRRGIGADGLVTLLPPRTPGAAATMHIMNSDGSVAEMCGNAIRCVAKHLAERRGLSGTLRIDTDAGTIIFHRVEYDVAATQRRMVDAGLPEPLVSRLAAGR